MFYGVIKFEEYLFIGLLTWRAWRQETSSWSHEPRDPTMNGWRSDLHIVVLWLHCRAGPEALVVSFTYVKLLEMLSPCDVFLRSIQSLPQLHYLPFVFPWNLVGEVKLLLTLANFIMDLACGCKIKSV